MRFRFWLCNLIFDDYLRNYLAFDRMALMQIVKYAEKHNGNIAEYQIRKLKGIAKDIDWLMTGDRNE